MVENIISLYKIKCHMKW